METVSLAVENNFKTTSVMGKAPVNATEENNARRAATVAVGLLTCSGRMPYLSRSASEHQRGDRNSMRQRPMLRGDNGRVMRSNGTKHLTSYNKKNNKFPEL
jgi:hypothetical protein